MKIRFLITVGIVLLASSTLEQSSIEAEMKDDALPVNLLTCEDLAANPDVGLAGNPNVKSATSRIIPATKPGAKSAAKQFFPPAGPNVAHCQVDILYGTNAEQNINIRVGLPLNSRDGGKGGIEGAWNGRTQGTGGGGCSASQQTVCVDRRRRLFCQPPDSGC